MRQQQVGLFGVFGWGNLGNECTLQAMLYHTRKHLPSAAIFCICSNPAAIGEHYQVATVPMRQSADRARPKAPNRLLRLLARLPREVAEWRRTFRTLKQFDTLIMSGTGMLDDYSTSPFKLPYELFRWSLLAKLCKVKLFYVSVGAGPLNHGLSRFFVKTAIGLADYRSYRDDFSKRYLQDLGFAVAADPIYPDLAFSLPAEQLPATHPASQSQAKIGVGIMTYFGASGFTRQGEILYERYLTQVTHLVRWLLEKHYCVRLVIGDYVVDERVRNDIYASLQQQQVSYAPEALVIAPIASLDDLLQQLACTDTVVATRFHNVLLALMLNKPVISISYNEKNDALMAEMGLAQYCQAIEALDVDRFIEQLDQLEQNRAQLQAQIGQQAAINRALLDQQYDYIFHGTPSTRAHGEI